MTTSKIRMALVITGLALTLSGCRYYWYKPQSTHEQFGRDSEACLQEARSASPVTARYNVVNQDVYRACLASRGYAREKVMNATDAHHRGHEFDD